MIMKLKLVSLYLIYVSSYKFGLPTIKKLKIFLFKQIKALKFNLFKIKF